MSGRWKCAVAHLIDSPFARRIGVRRSLRRNPRRSDLRIAPPMSGRWKCAVAHLIGSPLARRIGVRRSLRRNPRRGDLRIAPPMSGRWKCAVAHLIGSPLARRIGVRRSLGPHSRFSRILVAQPLPIVGPIFVIIILSRRFDEISLHHRRRFCGIVALKVLFTSPQPG